MTEATERQPGPTIGLVVRRFKRLVELLGIRQGLLSIPADLRKSPTLRQVRVDGAPTLWARLGRRESDLRTLRQVWLDDPYIVALNDRPGWIIDAGANVGYATRWFADRFPESTVVAIEPDPENVKLLRRNCENLPNVIVIEAALAAEPGSTVLVDPGHGSWALRAGDHAVGQGVSRGSVECVSIPQVMSRLNIPTIDVLKIDIEGAEVEVLQSAENWIDHVDLLIIELHDRYRVGCTEAYEVVRAGFKYTFVSGENHYLARRPLEVSHQPR